MGVLRLSFLCLIGALFALFTGDRWGIQGLVTVSYTHLYSWYICYVTLENKNLSHLPVSLLSEEQMSRYSIYMSTLGNRPDLFPDSPYCLLYTSSEYGRQKGWERENPATDSGNPSEKTMDGFVEVTEQMELPF